jgi:hypothetical protein
MESNKFDNHIKNVLEKRTISPSANAWDALENRLDKSKTTKKNWMLWSGVAASFIGVLITFSVLNTKPNDVILVETPEVIKTESNQVQPNQKQDVQVVESRDERIVNPKTDMLNTVNSENNATNTKKNRTSNSQIELINQDQKNIVVVEKDNTIIKEKADILITPVKKANTNEAEQLLAQALKNTTVKTKTTTTIDASSLLYDAELEVDQSFRTKLFATIKENISDLKTVIVDRNK